MKIVLNYISHNCDNLIFNINKLKNECNNEIDFIILTDNIDNYNKYKKQYNIRYYNLDNLCLKYAFFKGDNEKILGCENPILLFFQFKEDNPNYDYYIFWEDDLYYTDNIKNLIFDLIKENKDFYTLEKMGPPKDWMWFKYNIPLEYEKLYNCFIHFFLFKKETLNFIINEYKKRDKYYNIFYELLIPTLLFNKFSYSLVCEKKDIYIHDYLSFDKLLNISIEKNMFLHPIKNENNFKKIYEKNKLFCFYNLKDINKDNINLNYFDLNIFPDNLFFNEYCGQKYIYDNLNTEYKNIKKIAICTHHYQLDNRVFNCIKEENDIVGYQIRKNDFNCIYENNTYLERYRYTLGDFLTDIILKYINQLDNKDIYLNYLNNKNGYYFIGRETYSCNINFYKKLISFIENYLDFLFNEVCNSKERTIQNIMKILSNIIYDFNEKNITKIFDGYINIKDSRNNLNIYRMLGYSIENLISLFLYVNSNNIFNYINKEKEIEEINKEL